MPQVRVNGVNLYYEEVGEGTPLLFVHEFAGDYRSWEGQMRYFARRHRCIAFSARGYPGSDVPEDPAAYSQDIALDDITGLLDALGIDKAHLCGLSMGANGTLYYGLRHPERCLSLTIAGGGYGSSRDRPAFHAEVEQRARTMRERGMDAMAKEYTLSPARVQFRNKDPRGWAEFDRQFREHSAVGSANTLLGVQRTRPNVLELGPQMQACELPALIMLGDEDLPGLEGSLYMKRCLKRAGMVLFPRSGHTINLEEPALFNRHLLEFLTAVEAGQWGPRDPTAMQGVM